MSYFQVYHPFTNKDGRTLPGVRAKAMPMHDFLLTTQSDNVRHTIQDFRDGKGEKTSLPAVCWTGVTATGYRKAENMTATGFCMLDYDHVKHKNLRETVMNKENLLNENNVLLVHITPSGEGLRIVALCKENCSTLAENMEYLHKVLDLGLGDYDTAVKDVSRLSFMPQHEDIIYMNEKLWKEYETDAIKVMPQLKAKLCLTENDNKKTTSATITPTTHEATTTEELKQEDCSEYRYKGHLLSTIIKKYVEEYGEPGEGERHNFYNQMVKYFRNITDNNPQVLCRLLPRFDTDATEESCLSQCQSICRTNTTGKLPREFFLFLLRNGFYKPATETEQPIREEEVTEIMNKKQAKTKIPALPPVFKEIVGTCPKDFVVPCINALLPVMGTLTSNLRATYPFDARLHSTEFFSIIYAPPGTGKGFIERFITLLHRNLELRDMLSDRKESLFAAAQLRKGDNERAPENPHVSKRIMEAKNSETDFLEKQQANKGHHMFTYAAEMDQWRKGVRAAGGNKDDMIRIAWDNGVYGQSFKSANSFKGRVHLYWNVLITGTRDQLDDYFKNVTNGLVTRCGFSGIENQEYAEAPIWKSFSPQDLDTINKWIDKQDGREYAQPINFDCSTLDEVADEDFDREVPWKHVFREPTVVNIDWIMPTIKNWLTKQRKEALLAQNIARDVFRRRVAVRGFRLALLCTSLYGNIGETEQNIIEKFVKWWMSIDIENILALYGDKYNEAAKGYNEKKPQQGLWESLDKEFTIAQLDSAKQRCNVLSPTRQIMYVWKKEGLIKYNKATKLITKIKQ